MSWADGTACSAVRGGQGPRPCWEQWILFIILDFILKAMGNHRRVLKTGGCFGRSMCEKEVYDSSVKNGLKGGKAGSQTNDGTVAGGQVRDDGG